MMALRNWAATTCRSRTFGVRCSEEQKWSCYCEPRNSGCRRAIRHQYEIESMCFRCDDFGNGAVHYDAEVFHR